MRPRDLSKLYRAGATEEPRASLDRRIAIAARTAEGTSIARRLLQLRSSWHVGFSFFAVLVLSVSLTTVMHDEAPLRPEAGAPPLAAPAVSPSAAPSVEPAAERKEPPLRARALSDARPAAPSLDADARRTRGYAAHAERSEQALALEVEAEKRESRAEPEARRQAPGGMASNDPRETGPSRPDGAAPAPSAPMAMPSESKRTADRSSEASEVSSAPSARPRLFQAPKRAGAVHPDIASVESADAWLERIERLLAAGREPQARAEMHRLRERHPGYPIPVRLRHLLAPSDAPEHEEVPPGSGP